MTLAEATARLARGEYVHMQIRDGMREWWFEPGAAVSDEVMQAIQASGDVVETGDALFEWPEGSQTWRGRLNYVNDRGGGK